jgi:hypothetical protein
MSFSVQRTSNKKGNALTIETIGIDSLTNIRNASALRYVDSSFRAFYPTIPGPKEGGLSDQQLTDLNDYLSQFSSQSSKSIHMLELEGPGSSDAAMRSYSAVYLPPLNRIYFIPSIFTTDQDFYYIDCDTGTLQIYSNTSGVDLQQYSYIGGVYVPNLNRMYWGPFGQSSNASWHYIDGVTGDLVAYENGLELGEKAYIGIAYAPTLNRLYLVPFDQSAQSTWHYIDGTNGNVVGYTHGGTFLSNAFYCGAYSPTEDRIYLIPRLSNTTQWYYIDGATGTLERMTGIFPSLVSDPFSGAVYASTLNRIYLVPYGISNSSVWYYINCTNGQLEAYEHGTTGVDINDYQGGVYSPCHNRIYFTPNFSALVEGRGHYIDCDDGTVHLYTYPVPSSLGYYSRGTYSPTENRIYFARYYSESTDATLSYLEEFGRFPVDRGLMTHPMFGNY